MSREHITEDLEVHIPAGRVHRYTLKNHREFERDLSEDVVELALRMQRLKLRLLTYYERGALHEPGRMNEKDERGKKTEGGKLNSLALGVKYDRKFSSRKFQKLLKEVNRRLPPEFALRPHPFSGPPDAAAVSNLTAAMHYYPNDLPEPKRDRAEVLLASVLLVERRLAEMSTAPLLFQQGDPFEQVMRDCWAEYRSLLKETAALEESDSWFSPAYAASLKVQRGQRQRSERMRSDYQRWAMDEMRDLERELHAVLFRDSEYSEYARTLLFTSGTSSLQAVLRVLDSELGVRPKNAKAREFAAVGEIYVEFDDQVDRFCSAHKVPLNKLPTGDPKAVLRYILEELPLAVFLAPISNNYSMNVTEVRKILQALTAPSIAERIRAKRASAEMKHWDSPLYLVIDNTMLSRLASWKDLDFRLLPSFVKIFSIESLVKYSEDGMDLVGAGSVTAIGDGADSELESVRRRMGFLPTENSLKKLSFFNDTSAAARKLSRHARNTEFLLRQLEARVTKRSFISRVIHPGLSSHPDFSRWEAEAEGCIPLLNLSPDWTFLLRYREWRESGYFQERVRTQEARAKAERISSAYIKMVTALSREIGLEINIGSSFGFNTPRISIYERPPNDEEKELFNLHIVGFPYFRVAPGRENLKDAILFSSVLLRTNEIFTRAMRARRLFELTDATEAREAEIRVMG